MLFVGDDWAEAHHDVYLMNDTATVLRAATITRGLAGIARLHELVADRAADPHDVVIGIETDRGLWVQHWSPRVSAVRDQSARGGPLSRPPPRCRREVRSR